MDISKHNTKVAKRKILQLEARMKDENRKLIAAEQLVYDMFQEYLKKVEKVNKKK